MAEMSAFRQLLIVIPTRNRASLAVAAARSVLSSGLDEIRVVISDNSTLPAASEELVAACQSLGVAYWRPEAPLAMDAHWDWALRRAGADPTASHVTFLTDRMIVRATALANVLAIVRRFPTDVVSYGHDRLDDLRTPVELQESQWSGRLLRMKSSLFAKFAGDSDDSINMALPRLLNCVAPQGTVRAIEATAGSACGNSVSPDYAFAYRCVATVPATLFYDRSVLIHYALDRSNGASVERGIASQDHDDFVAALAPIAPLPSAPIPGLLTIHNAIAHEYRDARKVRPDWPDVAWGPYLAVLRHEVDAMTDGPMKVRARSQLRAFPAAIGQRPAPIPRRHMRWWRLISRPRLGMHRLLIASRHFKRVWEQLERACGITAPNWTASVESWPDREAAIAHVLQDQHPAHAGISDVELAMRSRTDVHRVSVVGTYR